MRKLDDLLVPEVVELVPEHVRFLACALHWAPQVWRSEAAVREHMQLRAHKEGFVRTVLQMIRAQDAFIQQHLRGELELPARAGAPRPLRSYFDDPDGELRLSPEQKRAADNVNQRVDQALRIREATDDQELERLMGLAEEHGSMVAILGEPGTGKTAVVDQCIRRAQGLGARILIALPTGVQRSRMKQRHPDVELDTCHGAFLFHRPLVEAMGVMLCCDLIFVDEAAQLFEEHFDRLTQMWLAAGKTPCVVFAGDEWQLPPPDHSKQSLVYHPKWRFVYKVELHKVWSGDRAPGIPSWTSWRTSARIGPWALKERLHQTPVPRAQGLVRPPRAYEPRRAGPPGEAPGHDGDHLHAPRRRPGQRAGGGGPLRPAGQAEAGPDPRGLREQPGELRAGRGLASGSVPGAAAAGSV